MAEKRSTVLRRRINREEILFRPGVAIALHAQIAQALGFEAVGVSGSNFAAHVLGLPDAGLITMTEIVENIRRICSAVSIPVIADCDTGFGNAINVRRTVTEIIRAGAAGLFIEDQVSPKRCGHMAGKAVIPTGEMVQKVKAAVDARRDPNFMIRARTDAAATHGIEEVIERLCRYAEAGADILFADALLSAEDIGRVACAVPKPLAVNMGFGLIERGTTPLLTPSQLQALGVSSVSYPRMLTSAALRGMMNALDAFAETIDAERVTQRPDLLVPFDELNRLMGLDELHDIENRFSGA